MDQLTKDFRREEFACPCCGQSDIDLRLVKKLQYIRDLLDEPIKITSGYRCTAHNKAVGGKSNSAHLFGFAADIAIPASSYRHNILPLLIANFNRTGIGPDFIHVDVDQTKPQNIIWVYPAKEK